MAGTIVRISLAGATLLLVACGSGGGYGAKTTSSGASSSGAAAAEAVTITAKDFAFEPTTVTWAPGASITVTFTNTGQAEHSFTPDGGLPEVEAQGGASKTLTLTAPQSGTLSFHCKYHPQSMRGTIVISGSGQAPSPGGGGTSAPAGGYGN